MLTVTCSSIQISGLPGDGGYVHGASSTTSTGGHGLGNGNSPWTELVSVREARRAAFIVAATEGQDLRSGATASAVMFKV